MRKRAESAAVYVLAFAVPAAVMLWAYASMGMAPWGDKTVLISDMSTQYVEFFCALKHGDLFFSWSKALGTSYIGVISYYVSSPLSLLTLLCPNEDMPVGLMFLTVLKIGLAGLSFAVFSVRRFPGSKTAALLCAVCYALMSYNAAYALCVMWLDGVIWLPLILLALERILYGRGAGPFIAALTVCFLSTWYISYMIGMFCCLYLAARLIVLKPTGRELGRIAVRFFGGAACALGLTAWMWLPTFLAMFAGKFSGAGVDYDGLLACAPLDLLKQFRPGQYSSLGYDALPYVFCGTVILALSAAYFFLRSIPLRERLASAGMLAVLAASLLLSPLDKVWHLFQRPNWFPFRYSFLFSFVLLCLAAQALPILLSALKKRLPQAVGAVLLAGLLTVLELGWNTQTILSSLEGQFGSESYQAYWNYYQANAELVSAAEVDNDEVFYRMGAAGDRGHNSPLSFGYAGITHYSSLYNADVNQLLKRLGFAQSWYWCASYGSTPLTDALLDIRYSISEQELPGYEPLAQSGGYTLWKNPYVLPLAFLTHGSDLTLEGDTAFARQNDLISDLLGQRTEVFVPLDVSLLEGDGRVELTVIGTGRPLYADLSNSRFQSVWVNGALLAQLGTSEAASVHYLGTPPAGERWTVSVCYRSGAPLDWEDFLWEYDGNALSAAVQALDNTEIQWVKNGGVGLTAQANTPKRLVTTIPAEDGWTAYIDGERTETGVYLDTFLSVELSEGTHDIELHYTAPGLVTGLILGGVAVLGLALAVIWNRRKYQILGGSDDGRD